MATAGATADPALPHPLLSLPAEIHNVIGAYLNNKEIRRMTLTAKALVRLYCGRLHTIVPRERHGAALPAAFGRLLRRLDALKQLCVDPGVLPFTASALMETDCGRQLEALRVQLYKGTPLACILPLFGASPGRLPALELLIINIADPEPVDLDPLLTALATGASPRLRELVLTADVRESGHVSQTVTHFASTLETRRAHGCAGLARLELRRSRLDSAAHWLLNGDLAARQRVWSVVLPTIEQLPDNRLNVDGAQSFENTILRYGAPRLKRVRISTAGAVRCLPALVGLEELNLASRALTLRLALPAHSRKCCRRGAGAVARSQSCLRSAL